LKANGSTDSQLQMEAQQQQLQAKMVMEAKRLITSQKRHEETTGGDD